MKNKNLILISIFSIALLFGSCANNNNPPSGCGTVTDIDGNVYQTVTIGTQCWMMENLKVTKYRNGDPIPNVTDSASWVGLTTGAYCNYNNDLSNVITYGSLYNLYAVSDSRNIAPVGWHIPVYAELNTLIAYLGGIFYAGGKMKETGTSHWLSPNNADNSSGFTGLPGGRRTNGSYEYIGKYGLWWFITSDPPYYSHSFVLDQSLYLGDSSPMPTYGISVRCIKD